MAVLLGVAPHAHSQKSQAPSPKPSSPPTRTPKKSTMSKTAEFAALRSEYLKEFLGRFPVVATYLGAEGLDPAAHEKLSTLVRYVWGTYDDPQTYVALRDALGAAKCPVHYLAIPPELFPTVIDQLGNVGLAERGRVVHPLGSRPPGARDHDRAAARDRPGRAGRAFGRAFCGRG